MIVNQLQGLNDYQTEGSIGVAIMAGVGGNLAFQNFQTNAAVDALQVALTINGDLTKRTIDLGVLPQTSGSFNLSFPADADISLFNTVIIKAIPTDIAIGTCRIA